MITHYSDANFRQMVPDDYVGVLPRRTRYGHDDAWGLGLTPIEYSSLDVLVWEDLKEAIQAARAAQAMPVFHQHDTWAPEGFRSNQDGLNYCWAWSAVSTFMDMRAMESKETVMLSPVSLGELVGWKNNGFYLDATASYIKRNGIAPVESVDGKFNSTLRNPSRFTDPDWKETRKAYRLEEVIDINTHRTDDRMIIRQAATALCAGVPLYMAINSMRHAMMITGIHWNESAYLNIKWDVRNSHNEPTTLLTEGERWVPDELIGFASSVLI